jgi:hypothetical protein
MTPLAAFWWPRIPALASCRQDFDRKQPIAPVAPRRDPSAMPRLLAATALLLLAGCAAPDPLWRVERGLVWCYRTLAAPECYSRPRPEAAHRLIAAAPQRLFFPLAPVGR